MATVNIVIINNIGHILRQTATNNLPVIAALPVGTNIENTATIIGLINAAPPFNTNQLDVNFSKATGLTEVIHGAVPASINLILNKVNSTFSLPNYSFSNNAVSGANPVGGAVANIPFANLQLCIPELPTPAEPAAVAAVPAVAPAAQSPKRLRFLSTYWPFGWLRMPPFLPSLAVPVKQSMPVLPPTVMRKSFGAPNVPSAPSAPRTNPPPADSKPRTRSPRQASIGSPRGRSASPRGRTGSPRGRTGSPRGRSASPRGRRGGYYEKYLKYKTKYLALKKELGL